LPGTQVLTDEHEIIEAIKKFQASASTFWGACVDSSLPAFSVGRVRQGYVQAKKRGVRGNFAVSDTEYVAGAVRGGTLASLVRSDLKELVQQRHVFDTLWEQAAPAKERMERLLGP